MAFSGANKAHEEREDKDNEEDEEDFIKYAFLGSHSLKEVLPEVRARDKFIKAQERRAQFIKGTGRRFEEIDMREYDFPNDNDDVDGPGMNEAMPGRKN